MVVRLLEALLAILVGAFAIWLVGHIGGPSIVRVILDIVVVLATLYVVWLLVAGGRTRTRGRAVP